jgi:hypothetical protein
MFANSFEKLIDMQVKSSRTDEMLAWLRERVTLRGREYRVASYVGGLEVFKIKVAIADPVLATQFYLTFHEP